MSSIQGLDYTPDVLNVEEANALLAFIDEQEWSSMLKRKVQQYGKTYSYKTRTLEDAPNIPQPLIDLMVRFGIDADQCIVNNYIPGEGISAHTDNTQLFDEDIYVFSLGSPVLMGFTKRNDTQTLILKPMSLLKMSGDARHNYTHEIPARKSDIINGKLVKRRRRVSITFRKIK